MTAEGLRHIIANPEGTEIEYKKSQTALARNVYETITAFLNRRGGHVVLGADNDGTILGIHPGSVQEQLDTLAKDMNNPQVISPTFYLNLETLEIDGKQVIYFYVPQSSQAHAYKGTYYDRNQDGDFALRNPQQVAELILREVCLNLLIHREYGARHEATFTIYKDRIETTNWNIPYHYGHITPGNLRPRAKNPVIANFFSQLGIVEELGNGTRTMFKYVPLISGGREPMLNEHDEFQVTIPYIEDEETANGTSKVTPDGVDDGESTRQVPDKYPTSHVIHDRSTASQQKG